MTVRVGGGQGRWRQRLGLVLGPVVFALVVALPLPAGLSAARQRVAAAALLMAIWWISEAIPIPATALLPIALFPALGVMGAAETTAHYGNHLIYLFMGGFWIAAAMERWNLHRRIALYTIRAVGVSAHRLLFGFMAATAFLSMWLSNTATTMMMLPIALAVLQRMQPQAQGEEALHTEFGTCLMLGIAYAASIGGVGTLIGTPPNAILAGVVQELYGYSIGFAAWMAFAVPLSAVMLLLTWLYLTRIAFPARTAPLPGGRAFVREELARLGPVSAQERWVLIVFLAVATGWILRGLWHNALLARIEDSTIAMAGALLLFIIPVDWRRGEFLLDWRTAVSIPWDVILLFGGGFALAKGFAASGLAAWVAQQLNVLAGTEWVIIVAGVTLLTIFLTEVTSNTATASMLLPVVAGLATATRIHPLGPMVGAALAASFAFMLPVATPPNAIVFASRSVSIPQMARAGLWLNLLGTVLIVLFVSLALPLLWGVHLGTVPAP